LVSLLCDEAGGAAPAHQLYVARLFDALLVAALQRTPLTNAERHGDARITRVLAMVHDNPAERWTLARLAKAAGMSRATFSRRFAVHTGASPLGYVSELRMERARSLLARGDEPVSAVAVAVGYASLFAFSRAFKRHVGCAPTVYRVRERGSRPIAMACGSALRLAA